MNVKRLLLIILAFTFSDILSLSQKIVITETYFQAAGLQQTAGYVIEQREKEGRTVEFANKGIEDSINQEIRRIKQAARANPRGAEATMLRKAGITLMPTVNISAELKKAGVADVVIQKIVKLVTELGQDEVLRRLGAAATQEKKEEMKQLGASVQEVAKITDVEVVTKAGSFTPVAANLIGKAVRKDQSFMPIMQGADPDVWDDPAKEAIKKALEKIDEPQERGVHVPKKARKPVPKALPAAALKEEEQVYQKLNESIGKAEDIKDIKSAFAAVRELVEDQEKLDHILGQFNIHPVRIDIDKNIVPNLLVITGKEDVTELEFMSRMRSIVDRYREKSSHDIVYRKLSAGIDMAGTLDELIMAFENIRDELINVTPLNSVLSALKRVPVDVDYTVIPRTLLMTGRQRGEKLAFENKLRAIIAKHDPQEQLYTILAERIPKEQNVVGIKTVLKEVENRVADKSAFSDLLQNLDQSVINADTVINQLQKITEKRTEDDMAFAAHVRKMIAQQNKKPKRELPTEVVYDLLIEMLEKAQTIEDLKNIFSAIQEEVVSQSTLGEIKEQLENMQKAAKQKPGALAKPLALLQKTYDLSVMVNTSLDTVQKELDTYPSSMQVITTALESMTGQNEQQLSAIIRPIRTILQREQKDTPAERMYNIVRTHMQKAKTYSDFVAVLDRVQAMFPNNEHVDPIKQELQRYTINIAGVVIPQLKAMTERSTLEFEDAITQILSAHMQQQRLSDTIHKAEQAVSQESQKLSDDLFVRRLSSKSAMTGSVSKQGSLSKDNPPEIADSIVQTVFLEHRKVKSKVLKKDILLDTPLEAYLFFIRDRLLADVGQDDVFKHRQALRNLLGFGDTQYSLEQFVKDHMMPSEGMPLENFLRTMYRNLTGNRDIFKQFLGLFKRCLFDQHQLDRTTDQFNASWERDLETIFINILVSQRSVSSQTSSDLVTVRTLEEVVKRSFVDWQQHRHEALQTRIDAAKNRPEEQKLLREYLASSNILLQNKEWGTFKQQDGAFKEKLKGFLQTTVRDLRAHIAKQDETLEKKSTLVTNLPRTIAEREQTLKDLNSNYAQRVAEKDAVIEKSNENNEAIAHIEANLQEIDTELKQVSKKSTDTSREVKKAQDELTKKKKKYEDLKADLNAKRDRLKMLSVEIQSVEGGERPFTQDVEKDYGKKKQESERLNREIGRIQSELSDESSLATEISKLGDTEYALRQQQEKLEEDRQNVLDRAEPLRAKKTALSKKKRALQEEITSLGGSINKIKTDMVEQEKRLSNAKVQLGQLPQEIARETEERKHRAALLDEYEKSLEAALAKEVIRLDEDYFSGDNGLLMKINRLRCHPSFDKLDILGPRGRPEKWGDGDYKTGLTRLGLLPFAELATVHPRQIAMLYDSVAKQLFTNQRVLSPVIPSGHPVWAAMIQDSDQKFANRFGKSAAEVVLKKKSVVYEILEKLFSKIVTLADIKIALITINKKGGDRQVTDERISSKVQAIPQLTAWINARKEQKKDAGTLLDVVREELDKDVPDSDLIIALFTILSGEDDLPFAGNIKGSIREGKQREWLETALLAVINWARDQATQLGAGRKIGYAIIEKIEHDIVQAKRDGEFILSEKKLRSGLEKDIKDKLKSVERTPVTFYEFFHKPRTGERFGYVAESALKKAIHPQKPAEAAKVFYGWIEPYGLLMKVVLSWHRQEKSVKDELLAQILFNELEVTLDSMNKGVYNSTLKAHYVSPLTDPIVQAEVLINMGIYKGGLDTIIKALSDYNVAAVEAGIIDIVQKANVLNNAQGVILPAVKTRLKNTFTDKLRLTLLLAIKGQLEAFEDRDLSNRLAPLYLPDDKRDDVILTSRNEAVYEQMAKDIGAIIFAVSSAIEPMGVVIPKLRAISMDEVKAAINRTINNTEQWLDKKIQTDSAELTRAESAFYAGTDAEKEEIKNSLLLPVRAYFDRLIVHIDNLVKSVPQIGGPLPPPPGAARKGALPPPPPPPPPAKR